MPQCPSAVPGRRRAALLIGLLSRLPLSALYALSSLLHLVLFRLAGFQRTLLDTNLRRAFPCMPVDERNRLASTCYRNALDFLFETIKAWRLDADQLARRVELENPQLLGELLGKHRTVLALTAHSGNWEWLQLVCSARLDAPLAAVYNPLNHRGVDALLLQLRTRFGSRLIDSARALPELVEFSRGGGIMALNADQGPRAEDDKYWTRLLGIDTAFYTGPEKLARLFQAPVVFVAMRRLRRGRYRVRFQLLASPPFTPEPGAVMQPYVRALEQQIGAAPADWFWLYKRWKYSRPAPRG
jgi:KDO2-lipid IV(A) lauroyltransferase